MSFYSANVTSYDAGGSGDNVVKDGLIKSVEKIWTDTYVIGADGDMTTIVSISIAKVPAWKKVTDVIVMMPAIGTVSTTYTLSLHLASAMQGTSATTGNLGIMQCISPTVGATGTGQTGNSGTAATFRLGSAGFLGTCGSTALDLWLQINPAGAGNLGTTGNTLKTLVRYV